MSLFYYPAVNTFLFGIFPYIGITLFLFGSLLRFDYAPYTWKSDASGLLSAQRELVWGSNLFHIGILFLFFGHFFGLLVPHDVYEAIGLSVSAKQMLAISSGGLAGIATLTGLALLIHRRIADERVRANSKVMDHIVLFWILAVLLLGLSSIAVSLQHRDGRIMLLLAAWAQHIWTLRTDASALILNVPLVYKIHLLLGMTLFILIPFSRLAHIWSGFASLGYIGRNYQLVRPRKRRAPPGPKPEI